MSTDTYSVGLVFASVCSDDEVDIMLVAVNQDHPTGLDHGWTLADEPFRTGDENPHSCGRDPARLHYLLVC